MTGLPKLLLSPRSSRAADERVAASVTDIRINGGGAASKRRHVSLQERIGLSPSGMTVRPQVALVTRPKLPYMARLPQTRPSQPPACVRPGAAWIAPRASRPNVTHKVRKM